MLLLHLLLHVLIYHLLSAKAGPRDTEKINEEKQRLSTYAVRPRRDTNYIVKRIENCPNVGYYFTRGPAPNSIDPGPCYLCFCQSNHTSVCWKRDNRKCNTDSFYYHGVGKRDIANSQTKIQKKSRPRRSPGFADIFFRDASRDVFNRNTEDQQCKPYESSFSDDCPPVDWCIGCTVCDCDPNGRWDCHILSFCPENKKGKKKDDGKKSKPDNKPPRKIVKKKPLPKTSPAPKITSTSSKKSNSGTLRRSANDRKTPPPSKRVVKSVAPKKSTTKKQQKKKPPLRYQKITTKKQNVNCTKPMVIKKNITTHKPLQINGRKGTIVLKKHDNHTVVIAQQVVKRMMDTVKQMVQREMRNVTKLISGGRFETNDNINAPNKQGRRQKRNLRFEDFNTTEPSPTVATILEGSTVASTVLLESQNIIPINGNDLNSDVAYYTYKPILSSTVVPASQNISPINDFNSDVTSYTYKPIQSSSVIPDSQNVIPINDNELNSNVVSYTYKPIHNSTRYEYYKYNVAIQSATSVAPLQTPMIDDVNKTTLTSINITAINNLKTNNYNNIEKNEINKSEINKMISDAVNKTRNCELTKFTNVNKTGHLVLNEHVLNKTKHAIINKPFETATETERTSTRFKILPSSAKQRNIFNNDIKLDTMPNTLSYLTDFPPEQSEIKIYKWQQLKKVKLPGDKSRNIVKVVNKTNNTKESKSILRAKDIGRLTVTKKYNLVKILNHHRCPFLENAVTSQPGQKKYVTDNILVKLQKIYNNTKATKLPKKNRKFNVIRYLKKIFSNIFKRKGTAGRYSRNHIIETLCEHFGPCIRPIKDKTGLLREKLAALDHETVAILKSVKIIKGLLRLLNGTTQANNGSNSQTNIQNDIQKLNSILKGNNANGYNQQPMTRTEQIQREYIKKNTQDFIISVGKFTTLLNQIIIILTKPNVNSNDNKFINKRPTKDSLQSLKHLILRYNLIQNNFMKRMYTLLNNYNDNVSEKPQKTITREFNSTKQIEILSKNIIKNLKKLKSLALSIKHNGRSKREVKDDAVEYLLILMEFLLKQNHPLDAAPVNDGIDLLIEAIRNAPDIKTIRKKVLNDTPLPMVGIASLHMTGRHSENSQSNSEDSPSISENHSNEDPGNLKIEYNEDNMKTKVDELDEDNIYQYKRAGVTPNPVTDVTSDMPSSHKLEDNGNPNTHSLDLNAEPGDTGNNFNYDTGGSHIDSGKNSNKINIFNNNSNNFEDNIEMGNTEIGKSFNSIFNDNTENLFYDKTDNQDMDFGRSNNVNIFDDNTEDKTTNFRNNYNHSIENINTYHGINENNVDLFNHNVENKNDALGKNNNNGNIFNDDLKNKNDALSKNNNNGNIFNDDLENKNDELGKINDDDNVLNAENKHPDLSESSKNTNISFTNLQENMDLDVAKNNNNDSTLNDNPLNEKSTTSKYKNIINIFDDITRDSLFNDNSEIRSSDVGKSSNYGNAFGDDSDNNNNITDKNSAYAFNENSKHTIKSDSKDDKIVTNVNDYNSISDKTNAYNIIQENGNSNQEITNNYNSIIENANSLSENTNNYDNAPQNHNNYKDIPDSVKTDTDMPITEETSVAFTEETTVKDKGVKKFETIYARDLDEEVSPLIAAEIEAPGKTTEDYEIIKKPSFRTTKNLDLTDSENADNKSKLEWIVENFGRDINLYEEEKDRGEKRDNIDHTTTMATVPPATTDPKVKTVLQHKKKVPKINTEEIMLKKQMDLLNSLDYGTERIDIDDTDSKYGTTEEKFQDTFAAYFV